MARNRIIPYLPDLKAKARKLRRESTHCEKLLWSEIKNKVLMGYQFHRQVPMLDYIADFYCHELMLVIEVDGSSHHSPSAQRYDRHRQNRLEKYGVHFLRFDDFRVTHDLDKVIAAILEWIVKHEAGV